jgi:preprotein translocase subunit SecA
MHDEWLARPREGWRDQVAAAPYPERADLERSFFDHLVAQMRGRAGNVLRPWLVRRLSRMADAVDALGPEMSRLGDDELRPAADALRSPLLRRGFTFPVVARCFALTREITYRHLGMRHHRVQLMGGWAMLQGGLAEMETGEGKTITALLPAVAAALANLPAHVITVNDYLARRDCEQLRPVLEALGLKVGLAYESQSPEERRAAYAADVTYCTNKDVVFDYLRDRMALGLKRAKARRLIDEFLGGRSRPLLLRGLFFAIIDEADSILIDEAKTPLILSQNVDSAKEEHLYRAALNMARQLDRDVDFRLSERSRAIELTAEGKARMLKLAATADVQRDEPLWWSPRALEEMVGQALSALRLFDLDRH